jgi:hypothetical protein
VARDRESNEAANSLTLGVGMLVVGFCAPPKLSSQSVQGVADLAGVMGQSCQDRAAQSIAGVRLTAC